VSDSFHVILTLHAAVTCFMAGVIWFVQLVHYPMLARIDPRQRTDSARFHQSRTTLVVAPTMLAELALAILILWRTPESVLSWVGAALLAVVWGSTFLVLVPIHWRLAEGDWVLVARLVQSNWIRTAAWTGRALIAMALIATAGH
jgi:uncharacterized membrane protein